MEHDLKITITVDVTDGHMTNKILNAIKGYVQTKIISDNNIVSEEFMEEVITEECGFDDETTFKDIGVDINISFEHDYM